MRQFDVCAVLRHAIVLGKAKAAGNCKPAEDQPSSRRPNACSRHSGRVAVARFAATQPWPRRGAREQQAKEEKSPKAHARERCKPRRERVQAVLVRSTRGATARRLRLPGPGPRTRNRPRPHPARPRPASTAAARRRWWSLAPRASCAPRSAARARDSIVCSIEVPKPIWTCLSTRWSRSGCAQPAIGN